MSELPIVIIGAGPVGLAALAQLTEAGEKALVLEMADEVASNIRQWGHVRMFSPWQYNVDAASRRLLEASGWQLPPQDDLPTGTDLREQYLIPLANLPALKPAIRFNVRVLAISRQGLDKMKDAGRQQSPFILHLQNANGEESFIEARAVLDASGTWHQANPIGANGLPAIGEKQYAEFIHYGIPNLNDPSVKPLYANQRVLVVGNGHSAINALLDLAELKTTYPDTRIVWALRSQNLQTVYGGQDQDALPARGLLGSQMRKMVESGTLEILAPFFIEKITKEDQGPLSVSGQLNGQRIHQSVDRIIATTGARPDLEMLRELRLDLDPALESSRQLGPLIDPNIHSCGTVRPHGEAELRQPEKDFYIVGMKSYGRAPTFLLATGYEQVRSVVAALQGDWEAARDVRLNLPETGVCITDSLLDGPACCGIERAQLGASFLPLAGIPIADLKVEQVTTALEQAGLKVNTAALEAQWESVHKALTQPVESGSCLTGGNACTVTDNPTLGALLLPLASQPLTELKAEHLTNVLQEAGLNINLSELVKDCDCDDTCCADQSPELSRAGGCGCEPTCCN